ncbi:hypothetical protein CTA2_11111 [Colletotrichum tanaceti]|uniref:AB hydrolase-1 domain-containing protein n=1 Tax=Colletotrichum tanaceti TaxID=1306861 RepID=A0A4U6X6U1_9PEZI|nr:hypothetical protein CTA2_11111 [Colletotrichum tanaceti]TKW51025.1 hypothetical protein CTA1_9763 [Colletotrichum tanaceti]
MARLSTILSLLGLAAMVAARNCTELTIPIDVAVLNKKFLLDEPKTDIDVTNFLLELAEQGGNKFVVDRDVEELAQYKDRYQLAATYCEPDDGNVNVLQVLTHGIGFDRSYWDFPKNEHEYSYVKKAVDNFGYATLAYDRLGVGASTQGNPIAEVEHDLQVAALKALTQNLRAATVPGITRSFPKIVHVGHGFGAAQTYALTVDNKQGELSDGIVLTGFSHNASFIPHFLLGGGFVKANSLPALVQYDDGYVAPATVGGVQVNFFAPEAFDPEILRAAHEGVRPAAMGELLTLGGCTGTSSSFTGPVLVITGDRDLPYCGGNCSATGAHGIRSILDTSANFMKVARPFESAVVAGAGHALALHKSHAETTKTIHEFLTKYSLGSRY